MRLTDLKSGESATIVKVRGYGAFRRRILEMGFIRGEEVSVILNAPLKDPIVYKIMGYEVSLRRSEASLIEVITKDEVLESLDSGGSIDAPKLDEELVAKEIERTAKQITVALVGNPNCGKTTLFNRASGSREHVGNYSGVTVDAKRGSFKHGGYEFIIYDLPGTYALSAYSPEEVYVRKHIVENNPDIILNVVAASNIERNLYLTTELINMDCSMVLALNMYDELIAQGSELDYDGLGRMLGVPIVPTNSRNGYGYETLYDTLVEVFERRNKSVRHIHINHGREIESSISKLHKEISQVEVLNPQFSSRYLSIKLLERDKEVELLLSESENYLKLLQLRDNEVVRIETILDEDIESAITSYNYGFISGALKESYKAKAKEKIESSRIIDTIVTHKLWGFPIFLFIMWAMFTSTFVLGAYPMAWIEAGVNLVAEFMQGVISDGVLKDLMIDGIIGGVGGVVVFLPNIVILYLFISFMEDSGYMARAAFIMDKAMHGMGLHGKSFIPLVMGFGCNVPAIIASRTIESHSSRLITILINPFMSCSARLPVYLLLIGAFFPSNAGTILFIIYLLGILVAVLTSILMRKTLFKRDDTPFVMELPPYRIPTLRSILTHMWDKSWQYLRKMGGVILVASIAIWFLSYYPRPHENMPTKEAQQECSYLGQLGRAVEPLMNPLGFTWQSNVAILSGMAAKEIVVSTLGVLYAGNSDATEGDTQLQQQLKATNTTTGNPNFTPITALAFMAFVLLCFPCIATLVAVASESGSWRWAAFMVLYNSSLAWIVAWLIKTIGELII
ncbi:MAG: ferrous iron transport protein B [Rikenellaceae bacterium]